MKRFILNALLLAILTAAALAAMPPSARAALDSAIENAVENAPSGTEVPWSGGPGLGGHIVVGKAFSQSTGEYCTGNCTDPCRNVDYQVSAVDTLTVFHGVRCLKVDDDGSVRWGIRGADMVVRRLSMMTQPEDPPPARATDHPSNTLVPTRVGHANSPRGSRALRERANLIVKIQQSLKHLLYYSGEVDGNFGSDSLTGLQEFLNDERSLLGVAPSEDVVNLLNAAEQRIGRGGCPRPSGVNLSDTVACATLTD
jgi:surface antigen